MEYPNSHLAIFIIRENRFIARCRLMSGEEVIVHVKNTGRGKEVLVAGALVTLQYWNSPKRKTNYDLIAVKRATNGLISTVKSQTVWPMNPYWTERFFYRRSQAI